MNFFFYFLSFFVIFFTTIAILHSNPIYSLLYLIISFIFISGIYFIIGAFFAAALQIILYAGAIMVLFVFVIMMLNLGKRTIESEKKWFFSFFYIIPCLFSLIFLILINSCINFTKNKMISGLIIDVKDVGFNLFNHYSIFVESISMILLTALIIILHIGKNSK